MVVLLITIIEIVATKITINYFFILNFLIGVHHSFSNLIIAPVVIIINMIIVIIAFIVIVIIN